MGYLFKSIKQINILTQDVIVQKLEWFFKQKWRILYLISVCIKQSFYNPFKVINIAALLKQIYVSGIDIHDLVLNSIVPSMLCRMLYLNGFFSKKDIESLIKENGHFSLFFITEFHVRNITMASPGALKLYTKLAENDGFEFKKRSDLGYIPKSLESLFFTDDSVTFASWFLFNTAGLLNKRNFVTLYSVENMDLYCYSMYCGAESIFTYLTEIGCQPHSSECLLYAVRGGSVLIINTICSILNITLDQKHFDFLLKYDHQAAIKYFYEKQKSGLCVSSVIKADSLLGAFLLKLEASQDNIKLAITSKSFNILMYLLEKATLIDISQNTTIMSLLFRAIMVYELTDIFELLLSKGLSPDVRFPKNEPIIFYLIEMGSLPLVKIVVEYGANLNQCGEQTLSFATEKNKKDIYSYLASRIALK